MAGMTDFRLERWDERGLVFERRANSARMQTFLGGVEADESVVARHQRFLDTMARGEGEMFLVFVDGEGDPVGSVGFWEHEWGGETVFELGWKVLPGYQGRGLAAGATTAALARAAATGRHRWAHAFPRTDNAASNGVCRRAGFELMGECDFEYPKGVPIRCHDWRADLTALPA
jgi:RimJ/RimL family protein N-acetyltransferase